MEIKKLYPIALFFLGVGLSGSCKLTAMQPSSSNSYLEKLTEWLSGISRAPSPTQESTSSSSSSSSSAFNKITDSSIQFSKVETKHGATDFPESNSHAHYFKKLHEFIDQQLNRVAGAINRDNTQREDLYGSYIVVGGFTQKELEKEWDEFSKNMPKISGDDSKRSLYDSLMQLDQRIAELEELREGIACVMLLIADNEDDLYKQIQKNYVYLTEAGVPIDGAYEVFSFDKNKRYEITNTHIRKKYAALGALHQVGTPLGQKVRQAGYTLSNVYGKRMYDAFLSGKVHLGMMRISPQDAEQFGIDFEALSHRMSVARNAVEKIKKEVDAELAKRF